MNFLSVCSGIEAASVAWHPLGWRAVGVSEIEKFPSQVLAHHYPTVPNFGDLNTFGDWPDDLAPNALVGGTPCQSFSIAGLRKGLADPRGNLALVYLALADRYRPEWLVWENVPGVLSSHDGRDFGAFLGALGQLGYGFAYRVLDAQYFGVAQRRRRVFVVANSRSWRRAAAVLFEPESMRGDPAPSRETREKPAPTIAARAGSSSGPSMRVECDAGAGVVVSTLDANYGRLHGCSGQDANHGHSHLVPLGLGVGGELARSLNACKTASGRHDVSTDTFVAHTLRGEGFDASEDGSGRGTPLVPVAFAHQAGGTQTTLGYDEACATAPTLAKCQTPAAVTGVGVRRLTPTECERLQGFPDGYTDIRHGGKPTPDGPRYKALGNSMAVPVMRWIGKRIQAVAP